MSAISGGFAGKTAFVLGAGRQGTCAAYDFLRYGGAGSVRLMDSDHDTLTAAADRLRSLVDGAQVDTLTLDGSNSEAMTEALRGTAAGVCALPYRFGPIAARAAAKAGASLADLGGNSAISGQILELDALARDADVSLIPDTGLAPGVANTLAAAGIERLAESSGPAKHVHMWCGGLPEKPIPPLGYRLVFNINGLFNEYCGHAEYIRQGKRVQVPTLSEIATLDFPGMPPLEAFPTSGGTSTGPDTFNQLETYEYRTVRYPGHCEKFRTFKELGLMDESSEDGPVPRELLARLLTPMLDHPEVPDLVVLRVDVANDSERIRYDVLDRQDAATGFTAMERCTAHPAAIVAEMAAAGETERGGIRLEVGVPPKRFLERMAERPIPLDVSVDAL